ncbi:hypothetical protein GQ600_6168 [Phytophthora cactorum]|nr:hypothetical protein GQ600_6168 [Phytophthora cactorum]
MALSTTHLTGKLPTRTCSTLSTNLSGLAANQENSEPSDAAPFVEARLKAVLRKFFANRDYSPSIFVDDSNKTYHHAPNSSNESFLRGSVEATVARRRIPPPQAPPRLRLVSVTSQERLPLLSSAYPKDNLVYAFGSLFLANRNAVLFSQTPDPRPEEPAPKDFERDQSFEEAFPLARVLICHFHPKKYLRTEMSKPVYGGRDAVE